MKKVFFLMALALGATTMANAQAEYEKGDVTAEIGFTPFKESGETFKLNEGMLKLRYFLSDKNALRLKIGVGVDSKTKDETSFKDADDKTIDYVITEGTTHDNTCKTQIELAVGFERHIKNYGNLDIYAGGEIGYGWTSCGATSEQHGVATSYDASGKVTATGYQDITKEMFKTDGNNKNNHYLTVAAFAGMDFYVYKGLYLGAELGLQFKYGKTPNTYTESCSTMKIYNAAGVITESTEKITSTETGITTVKVFQNNQTTETITHEAVVNTESSSTSLKLYVEPSIRLGWKF